MYINRDIESVLPDWKNNSSFALEIEGSRQVGKTTTIKNDRKRNDFMRFLFKTYKLYKTKPRKQCQGTVFSLTLAQILFCVLPSSSGFPHSSPPSLPARKNNPARIQVSFPVCLPSHSCRPSA